MSGAKTQALFTLDMPTEPYWIDLPMGVRLKIRPMDGIIMSAARTFAFDCCRQLLAQREERIATGVPVDDLLDVSGPDLRDGFVKVQLAAALARYGALEWSGVFDAAGDAVAFSRNDAERLARHPVMVQPFLDACFAPSERVAAEGNASAPAPNGSSAAGADTAMDAESPATPVQGS